MLKVCSFLFKDKFKVKFIKFVFIQLSFIPFFYIEISMSLFLDDVIYIKHSWLEKL